MIRSVMDFRLLAIPFLAWTVHGHPGGHHVHGGHRAHDHNCDLQCIKEEWPRMNEVCRIHAMSPVDIVVENATEATLQELIFNNYWANEKDTLRLIHEGKTVKFERISSRLCNKHIPTIRGGPLFNNEYIFEQMHLHWGKNDTDGSEHSFNGDKYSAEMHLVHYKAKYSSFEEAVSSSNSDYGAIAVLAFFGNITAEGSTSAYLWMLMRHLESVRECNAKTTISIARPFQFIKSVATSPCYPDNRYYAYPGSLTTAPFLENVIWIVFPCPFKISPELLSELRKLEPCKKKTAHRGIQPFNNRPIIYAN